MALMAVLFYSYGIDGRFVLLLWRRWPCCVTLMALTAPALMALRARPLYVYIVIYTLYGIYKVISHIAPDTARSSCNSLTHTRTHVSQTQYEQGGGPDISLSLTHTHTYTRVSNTVRARWWPGYPSHVSVCDRALVMLWCLVASTAAIDCSGIASTVVASTVPRLCHRL